MGGELLGAWTVVVIRPENKRKFLYLRRPEKDGERDGPPVPQ